MANEKLTVVPEDATVAAEQLADAIRKISDGTQAMLKAGLNRRALCVLLKDSTGVGIAEIKKVLEGLSDLSAAYVSKRLK